MDSFVLLITIPLTDSKRVPKQSRQQSTHIFQYNELGEDNRKIITHSFVDLFKRLKEFSRQRIPLDYHWIHR